MNTFFKFLGACSFGLSAACLFWLAVELDNAELQAGKSPHLPARIPGFARSIPLP